MISAHEVRIGNYVKCTRGNDAGIYRVFALDGKGLNIMLDGVREGEWLRDSFHEKPEVKGIKLTNEWLLDFGFTLSKDKSWSYINIGKNFLLIKDNYAQYHQQKALSIKEEHNIFYIGEIKYIHQLQNLYFTLTQKELTI